MSQLIAKSYNRDAYARLGHHVAESHKEQYPVVRHTDAQGTARNLPASQHVSIPAFRISTLLAPETSVPSGAFSGTGGAANYTSFELHDSQLNLLQELHVQFQTSYTSTASGDVYTARPAWLHFDRIELRFHAGNSSIVLDPLSQHLLWLSSQSDEAYRTCAPDYGMSASDRTAVLPFAASTASGETFTRTYRVKLSSVFEVANLYPQGISSPMEVRIYWNSTAHSAVTGSPSSISLNSCNMVIAESHVDLATHRRQIALYQNVPQGLSIRYPDIRTSVHTFNGVTTGTSFSQVLQSHTGYCAALMVYFRSTTKSGTGEYTFASPTDLSLVDDANHRMTQDRMDAELMQRILFKQTDFAGVSTASDVGFQVIPFGLSLSSLIHRGQATGGVFFNGREKLTFTASAGIASFTNCEMVVHSIMYSMMDIKRGQITFSKS